MELVTIIRELWRFRLLVALVAVGSIAIGCALAYHISWPPESRSYTVGVATARILVDTPSSQVVEVAPKGSEALGARASVLANLMIDGKVKSAIARRASVVPSELAAGSQSTGGPEAGEPLGSEAYALKTGVVVNSDLAELPIIKVEAQAPDTARAIALADAAVAGLSDYLAFRASNEEIDDARRLRVTGLGAAQGHEEVRGPGRVLPLAAAIFAFLAGCAAILITSALVRDWRRSGTLDEYLATEVVDDDLPDDEASESPIEANETTRLRREYAWGSASA